MLTSLKMSCLKSRIGVSRPVRVRDGTSQHLGGITNLYTFPSTKPFPTGFGFSRSSSTTGKEFCRAFHYVKTRLTY